MAVIRTSKTVQISYDTALQFLANQFNFNRSKSRLFFQPDEQGQIGLLLVEEGEEQS